MQRGVGLESDLRTFSKVCTLGLQDGVRGLRELDDGLVEGGWRTDRMELHRVEEERRRAESADDCGWDLHAHDYEDAVRVGIIERMDEAEIAFDKTWRTCRVTDASAFRKRKLYYR